MIAAIYRLRSHSKVNVCALCKIFRAVQRGDSVTMTMREVDGPLVVTIESQAPLRQIRYAFTFFPRLS
jgi:hypothetical protein